MKLNPVTLTIILLLPCYLNRAQADSVRVTPATSCKGPVGLSAQNAKLSEVLLRLSESLGFSLKYMSQRDPLINVETNLPAIPLIRSLTTSENLVLVDEADAQCPGVRHIVKVALLPKGPETAARPLPPPAMTQQQSEALAFYRRAHGLDENGQPPAQLSTPPSPR